MNEQNYLRYENFLQLTQDEGFDPNHWVNREYKSYLSEKRFKSIRQSFAYVPEDILNRIEMCGVCKKRIAIDWLEKRPPALPVFLRDCLYCVGSLSIVCNHCGNNQSIETPRVEYAGIGEAYGDEAIRHLGSKMIVTYSIVRTLDTEELPVAIGKFKELKKDLAPSLNPDTWTLHMTNIWSHKWRMGRPEFSHIKETEVMKFCADVGSLLREHSTCVLVYNSSGVFYKKGKHDGKSEEQMKERVYQTLLARVINESARYGVATFLRMEKAQGDGWAKNLFSGLRLTLLWPFLTFGLPIKTPEFVQKSPEFGLEIADFASFTIARYLHNVWRRAGGAQVKHDANPLWLGKAFYQGFKSNGECLNFWQHGYPLDAFFKGTYFIRDK